MSKSKEQFFLFLGFEKREEDTNYWVKKDTPEVTILFDREDHTSIKWLMEMYKKINNTFPYTMHIEGESVYLFKEEESIFSSTKSVDDIESAMMEVINMFLDQEVGEIFSLVEMTTWL